MTTSPIDLVREYLDDSGNRRMDEAARFLDDEVLIIFPQGRFNSLDEMVSAMKGRYRSIGKTHDTWDALTNGSETVVVTTGRLHGINNHGAAFAGIRFCDRFVIRDGRIVEQHVWNDLAESGVLDQR